METTHTTLRFALLLTITNGFLDPYTYLARGGVFTNAQTGNVIFFAINLSDRHFAEALSFVWPILAFLAGVMLSSLLKSGRLDNAVRYPMRATMGSQAAVLAVIGFVPASVPHTYVTVPMSLLAAIQIGLFRNVEDLAYVAIATTGNLMRLVESGYGGFIEKDAGSRRAFPIYAGIIGTFAAGAIIGAVATHALGPRAVWIPAALLGATLVMFVLDSRRRPA